MGKTPKVEARFHGSLQKVFQQKAREVELSKAPNVRGLIEVLCSSPEPRREFFDDHGHIRSNLVILRNGRNIGLLNGVDTELNDGDSVAIFLPTYGG